MYWFLLLTPFIIPFILKPFLRNSLTFQEMGIQGILCMLVVVVIWNIGKANQVADVEIWNGNVVSKHIEDDWYQTSYSCPPCTKSCTGSGSTKSCTETCSTCYTDHYTREWFAKLSTGDKAQFKKIDTESKRRRDNAPEPARYQNCVVGESASVERTYTNYVQAEGIASTIYDTNWKDLPFANVVPSYPRVFDFYRINRVINGYGNNIKAFETALNDKLSLHLQKVGYQKQANVVVVLTTIQDQSYRYTVENAWLGGNKNDIVVFIGLGEGKEPKPTWVDVMTFALNEGNETLRVELRERLSKEWVLDGAAMADIMIEEVVKHYTRPTMEARNHLAGDVAPSAAMIWTAWILMLLMSAGLTYFFHKHDVDIIGAIREAIARRGRRGRYNRRYR